MKNRIFRNSIIIACAMTLLCCTSSTQATRAMNSGGAMLVFGSAAFLGGYATRNENAENAALLMPIGGLVSSVGFWTLVIGAATRPSLRRIESLNHQLQSNNAGSQGAQILVAATPIIQPVESTVLPIIGYTISADAAMEIHPRLTNTLGYLTASVPCYGPNSPQSLKIYDQNRNLVHTLFSDLELDNSYYFPIDESFLHVQNQDVLLTNPSHRYEVCNRRIEI